MTNSPEYFQNVASGNARVGVQAGHISGGVFSGAPPDARPADVAAALDELLAALRAAYEHGELDRETLADSEHEVGVTRTALASADPEQHGRAVRALRKLGGLVGGLAGSGTAVATLLAQVERLTS
ncbi:hypothetical protein [Actinoplanes sp. NPDC049599]|uniref:hypothetical protein n=1 Tax=Actinoplanes sp. NPDC049599 TaxID=3363903 RepID=UPI00379B4CDD